MSSIVDRLSEAAVSTLFDATFIAELKKYLGLDPLTPSEDLPINVEDVLADAISICETEQWRFILPKDVKMLLPLSALCEADHLLYLPFGPASTVVIKFLDVLDATNTINATKYTVYAGEPLKVWTEDWDALVPSVDTHVPYPITVEYTTGYTAYKSIPKATIRALKILCHHLVWSRDMPIPDAYHHNRNLALLADYRAIKYVSSNWSAKR